MIIEMDRAWRDTAMAISMKESLKTTNRMAEEFMCGSMAKFMRASGGMGLRKARVFGKEFMATPTLASGYSLKPTGMESTSGRTVIDTKVSGSFVSSMGRAQIFLRMAMCTMASTKMASHTALDNTNGKTLQCM
jgi:hypothetical protein